MKSDQSIDLTLQCSLIAYTKPCLITRFYSLSPNKIRYFYSPPTNKSTYAELTIPAFSS